MRFDRDTRVALIAEEFSSAPDEGSLCVLARLAEYLHGQCELRVYHARGSVAPQIEGRRTRLSRTGVAPGLWRELRAWGAELVLYVPSASATPNALWRARLHGVGSGAPVVLMALQQRKYGLLGSAVIRLLRPELIVAFSEMAARALEEQGACVLLSRLGVDLTRFRPLDHIRREAIRTDFGWAGPRTVVLHVGHLRHARGLGVLKELAQDSTKRVVMVASVSERGEEALARELTDAGVELHCHFIRDIERFYQAADIYLFPVREHASAIDFPLSVFEALASGMPVLSTQYGALGELFDDAGALRWLRQGESVAGAVEELMARDADGRALAEPFGWDASFATLLKSIEEAL